MASMDTKPWPMPFPVVTVTCDAYKHTSFLLPLCGPCHLSQAADVVNSSTSQVIPPYISVHIAYACELSGASFAT